MILIIFDLHFTIYFIKNLGIRCNIYFPNVFYIIYNKYYLVQYCCVRNLLNLYIPVETLIFIPIILIFLFHLMMNNFSVHIFHLLLL